MARLIGDQTEEGRSASQDAPPREAVLACLARVLRSRPFVRSRRLQDFLRYAVEAALEGREAEVKERTLAVDVYGRRADYDPRVDPIVRSEAHRLRGRLASYYKGEGLDDPVVIDVPKGAYLPVFRARQCVAGDPRITGDARPEALFAKGQHGVLQFATTYHPEYLEAARRRLGNLLEVDPGYTDALAALSFLEFLGMYPPLEDPTVVLSRVQALLDRALAREPRHARALCLQAEMHALRGRRRDALLVAETAVAHEPNDAEAWTFHALRLQGVGFLEASADACDRAIALDPVWDVPYYLKTILLAGFHRFDEARRVLDDYAKVSTGMLSRYSVAYVAAEEGDWDVAERAMARAEAGGTPHTDTSFISITRGLVAARRGDLDTAREVFETYADSPPRHTDHLIRLALALGEADHAAERLARSPFHGHYRWLATQPLARPYLRKPAFRKLLRELHGTWQLDLEQVGPRLAVQPPTLPTPDALLRARAGGVRVAS